MVAYSYSQAYTTPLAYSTEGSWAVPAETCKDQSPAEPRSTAQIDISNGKMTVAPKRSTLPPTAKHEHVEQEDKSRRWGQSQPNHVRAGGG